MGRPRLTPEQLTDRIAEYCRRYGLPASVDFPPFPSGRRETDQHRDWMKLYKARARLAQYDQQRAAVTETPLQERQTLAAAQDGLCPICLSGVDVHAAVDRRGSQGPALVHDRCQEVLSGVVPLGPEGLERILRYLWTPGAKRGARRSAVKE